MAGDCERCKKRVDSAFDEELHHCELIIDTYYYGVHNKKLQLCLSCLKKIILEWRVLVGLSKTKEGK